VEKIVRESVVARRARAANGSIPTQAELLKLWAIKEQAAQAPQAVTRAVAAPSKPAVDHSEPAKRTATRAATALQRANGTKASSRSSAAERRTVRS
jgi:hypothetical protein